MEANLRSFQFLGILLFLMVSLFLICGHSTAGEFLSPALIIASGQSQVQFSLPREMGPDSDWIDVGGDFSSIYNNGTLYRVEIRNFNNSTSPVRCEVISQDWTPHLNTTVLPGEHYYFTLTYNEPIQLPEKLWPLLVTVFLVNTSGHAGGTIYFNLLSEGYQCEPDLLSTPGFSGASLLVAGLATLLILSGRLCERKIRI